MLEERVPKVGAACFFELVVNICLSTRDHVPEDRNLHCHYRESLKPRTASEHPFVYSFFSVSALEGRREFTVKETQTWQVL